jgi:hypothetical protein
MCTTLGLHLCATQHHKTGVQQLSGIDLQCVWGNEQYLMMVLHQSQGGHNQAL